MKIESPAEKQPASAAIAGQSRPKGRPPGVFVFNPFTEGRLAEGKAFNPTQTQAQLGRDLENLPQFLCRQNDIVLAGRKPSVEFLNRIKQAGFPLPEFVELSPPERRSPAGLAPRLPPRSRPAALPPLASRKLGGLHPWAWGPDSVELLQPLFACVTGERRAAAARFNERLAQLYSKSWSANFLRGILGPSPAADALPHQPSTIANQPSAPWLCTENDVAVPVRTLDDALAAIARIRARGHHPVVVKQSLGVAGSNAVRLLEPQLLPAQLRWLERALARSRELVVEPWLERLQDFSVQLEMTPRGLRLCGFTGLVNDARGQFAANVAEPRYRNRLPAAVVSLFPDPPAMARRLLDLYDGIFARLETALRAVDFVGPLGIDAFVYRAEGRVRLKPVVEINPRCTMGRVLVELMRHAGPASTGVFRLLNRSQLRAEGFEDFSRYARALEEKCPLQFENESAPRIRDGALCLNDPAAAQCCLAVFQVAPQPSLPGP